MNARVPVTAAIDPSTPAPNGRLRVAIVGGGAAGTLLALHLQQLLGADGVEVLLYDRNAAFARGVAYGARSPWHCLNVPAIKMGGWHVDDVSGFANWLHHHSGQSQHDSEQCYAERSVYGVWLTSLLEPLIATHQVLPVAQEVVDIVPRSTGAIVVLDDQAQHVADAVVLCHGNTSARALRSVVQHARHVPQVWQPDALVHIPPDDAVLIVGSGASGVDVVLELLHRGHRGPVRMVSRRGMLPQPEALGTVYPEFLVPTDGAGLRQWLRQTRREAAHALATGRLWQNVMDAVLRQADLLWSQLTERERQQFTRHVRPFWMSHRHRANPAVLRQLDDAERSGQLQRIAGRLVAATPLAEGFAVQIHTRDASDVVFSAGWVLNATGPEELTHRQSDPLTVNLVRRGLAQPGPLGLGLAVAQDGRVLGAGGDGQAEPFALFALGLPTRGTFWEVTSVPALRGRAGPLAQRLAALREHRLAAQPH